MNTEELAQQLAALIRQGQTIVTVANGRVSVTDSSGRTASTPINPTYTEEETVTRQR